MNKNSLVNHKRQPAVTGRRHKMATSAAVLPFLFCLAIGMAVQAADTNHVSFYQDVYPLFKRSCTGCHHPGKLKGQLDLTTYQTPMFEATTDPNGSADIIDGVIEEGSVYHHDVILIARTADGRAWSGGWGYLVAHRVGSQSIEIFSKQNESQGSINPAPTSEVLAVGDRRILRVHGNGQDTLQWSAVVQRVKILPPGR